MATGIAPGSQKEYEIRVELMWKGTPITVNYSGTDTVDSLKKKIFQEAGAAIERQELRATYDWTRCYQIQKFEGSDELLINRLRHVNYLAVYLMEKKVRVRFRI